MTVSKSPSEAVLSLIILKHVDRYSRVSLWGPQCKSGCSDGADDAGQRPLQNCEWHDHLLDLSCQPLFTLEKSSHSVVPGPHSLN